MFKSGEIPVVISVYNEAKTLPRVLNALARQTVTVEPIVVNNGSTDGTPKVVEENGVTALEQPAPGKLHAIQRGIEYVREHTGDNTPCILFTDGDSTPNPRWVEYMTAFALDNFDDAGIATGLVVYRDSYQYKQQILNALRFFYANCKNIALPIIQRPPIVRGFNMVLQSDRAQTVLDDILDMPNYFPGEDLAMRDAVLENGGRALATFHPSSTVFTSGDRYASFSGVATRCLKGPSYQETVYSQPELPPERLNPYLSPRHIR